MKCNTCRFWERDMDSPEAGNCRRYGPQPLVLDSIQSKQVVRVGWPRTFEHDWCGEWVTSVGVEKSKTD
jgi:hypothetical protein